METERVTMLKHQLRVAWSLAEGVLGDLTDEEALWCPSEQSWTVRQGPDGHWHADWEEPEPWPAPPTSLAWVQWHLIWFWSTVIDRSFGPGDLQREEVTWPGAAQSMEAVDQLRQEWIRRLESLSDADLSGNELTRWPYDDGRPFAIVADWVCIEVMKNVAEMSLLRRIRPGYAGGRFQLMTIQV
jgi:hypothetical protein